MRVIARATLRDFVRNRCAKAIREDLGAHLDSWFAVVSRAGWANSAELKQGLRSASIVSAHRVVFNIKGNAFRLITDVDYEHRVVFVKWLGTHREYDGIDVKTVAYDKERYADKAHSD